MMTKQCRARQFFALAVLGLCALWAATAAALDVADVQNLIRNQVSEEVIINMVKSDGSLYITPEEANVLRSQGASENLITALRPTPYVVSAGSDNAAAADDDDDEDDGLATEQSAPLAAPIDSTAPAASAVVVETVPESPAAAPASLDGSPITLAPITNSSAFPPRYDKEGWLSISNHDWIPYYLRINPGDKRMFISKTPNGGMLIQSGQNLVVNLRKETYKLYGDTGEDLKIRIRESETTRLSLNPFGVFGNSGLNGVAVDRDRVRSQVLFNNYVPPIVVQQPPVVVYPAPPPPPPVYYYGPRYRPYYGGGFYYRRW